MKQTREIVRVVNHKVNVLNINIYIKWTGPFALECNTYFVE